MLRSIIAVLFISLTINAQATGDAELSNDTSSKQTNVLALKSGQFQKVLLQGIWTEIPASETTGEHSQAHSFQFHDFGMVDVFTESEDGSLQVNHLFYSIEETDEGIVLEMSNPPITDHYEMIVQTMNSDLMKVELNGESLELSALAYHAPVQDQVESILIGSWETMSYPFDVITDINLCGTFEEINGARLTYDFFADGTYTRHIVSNMIDIEEKGIWEVSKSGEYLTFYAAVDHNPEQVYATHVAKLQGFDGNEVTINQSLTVPYSDFETLFCTCNKDFTLEKVQLTSLR